MQTYLRSKTLVNTWKLQLDLCFGFCWIFGKWEAVHPHHENLKPGNRPRMIQNGPVNHEKSQQQCLSGLNLGWDMCLTPECLTPMSIFFWGQSIFLGARFSGKPILGHVRLPGFNFTTNRKREKRSSAARAWRARSAASAFPTCRGWVKGTIFHRKS